MIGTNLTFINDNNHITIKWFEYHLLS